MKVSVIQHAPTEDLGNIRFWLSKNNCTVTTYHPYIFDKSFPSKKDADLLILLGGGMSANDDVDWIKKERKLIRDFYQENIPILGICFGGQQIAAALGGKVQKNKVKEVGWDIISLQNEVIPGLPQELNVLHWHEDTFSLPNESKVLYSSQHTCNQGFIISDNCVALQFHLEKTNETVRDNVVNFGSFIDGSALNQTELDILNHDVSEDNYDAMEVILNYITKSILP